MNRSTTIEELEIGWEIFKRSARRHVLPFTGYTFGEDEPYYVNWHHRVTANEIVAWATSPEPYHLMIFEPPRHGKSELASIRTPAWLFGINPNAQIIGATYNGELANYWGRNVQKVMLSREYHELFPDTRLATRGRKKDESGIRQMHEFTISGARGIYRSSGLGGGITGRGANYLIIDDPIKGRQEAESETQRNTVKEWYKSTLRTRLQPGGRMMLIMTRWHQDDLAGWLLTEQSKKGDADQWRVVSLPATFERTDITHSEDKRSDGQALWERSYPIQSLNKIRATLGTYDWSALYQQRPTPPGGAVIKRHWLQVIDYPPDTLNWVRAWDLAVTAKTSADFSASGMMAIDDVGRVYVKGFVREQEEWPTIRKMILSLSRSDAVPVGVEAQGVQKGFVDDLFADKEMQQVDLHGYTVSVDKKTRALPWVARAEAGKFYIVRGSGVDAYIEELIQFTGVEDTHDDQVDWTSIAWKMLVGDEDAEIEIIGEYQV